MIYQDTPRFVGLRLITEYLNIKRIHLAPQRHFFHQQKYLYSHRFVLLSKAKEKVCQFHNLVHCEY